MNEANRDLITKAIKLRTELQNVLDELFEISIYIGKLRSIDKPIYYLGFLPQFGKDMFLVALDDNYSVLMDEETMVNSFFPEDQKPN